MLLNFQELKTEDEFFDDDEDAKSVNEVEDVPQGFKDWIRDNEDRISRAEKRGTVPYFIADNRGLVDEILQSKMMDKFKDEPAQSSNLIEDNQYRGSLFARTLNNVQTKLISRQLKDFQNSTSSFITH